MSGRLGRRSFFCLVAGASAYATGLCLRGRSAQLPSAGSAQPTAPSRLRSSGGRLELDLVAQETNVAILGGPARALTYNGLLPGPVLEAEPGDAVRIQLHNRLARPTNLHYHGLHIPPGGSADNVFVSGGPRPEPHLRLHPAGRPPRWHLLLPPPPPRHDGRSGVRRPRRGVHRARCPGSDPRSPRRRRAGAFPQGSSRGGGGQPDGHGDDAGARGSVCSPSTAR